MCTDFPIIAKLGGREAVMAILRDHGVGCKGIDTVRMWSAPDRRKIPGQAIVALMKHCDAKGIPYHGEDFEVAVTTTRPSECATGGRHDHRAA